MHATHRTGHLRERAIDLPNFSSIQNISKLVFTEKPFQKASRITARMPGRNRQACQGCLRQCKSLAHAQCPDS